MKKLIFLVLILPILLQGQDDISTEKYIRIVGLAEQVVKTDGMEMQFTLSEIQGNEYKQVRPKSLEDVKSEFIQALKTAGVGSESLKSDVMKNIKQSKYNNIVSENYTLKLKDKDEALKISNLDVDGMKIGNVTSTFPSYKDGLADDLSLEAIADAKRKATNIAKAINRELGPILNISDMNTFKSQSSYNSTSDSKTMSYRVNVTFELN